MGKKNRQCLHCHGTVSRSIGFVNKILIVKGQNKDKFASNLRCILGGNNVY